MPSLAGRRVSLSALGQQCCQNLEILLCGLGATAGGLQTSAVNCLHWTATYMQGQEKLQFAVCLKFNVAKISMPTAETHLVPSHLTEGNVLHSCTVLLLHVTSNGDELQVSFTLPEGAKCEQGERTPGKPFQRSPRRVSPNKSHSRSVRHSNIPSCSQASCCSRVHSASVQPAMCNVMQQHARFQPGQVLHCCHYLIVICISYCPTAIVDVLFLPCSEVCMHAFEQAHLLQCSSTSKSGCANAVMQDSA